MVESEDVSSKRLQLLLELLVMRGCKNLLFRHEDPSRDSSLACFLSAVFRAAVVCGLCYYRKGSRSGSERGEGR
jgi:hypothetical protein